MALIAKRLTLKQIAAELAISESAINKHIRSLKEALNVNSLAELAEIHNTRMLDGALDGGCRKPAGRISTVLGNEWDVSRTLPNDSEYIAFADSSAPALDGPLQFGNNYRVVPRWLDGRNPVFARLAAMLLISTSILVLLVTALTAAKVVSEEVSSSPANLALEANKSAD